MRRAVPQSGRRRARRWLVATGIGLLAAAINYALFLGVARVTPTARFWELITGDLLRDQAQLLAQEAPQPSEVEMVALPPAAQPIVTQHQAPPPPRTRLGKNDQPSLQRVPFARATPEAPKPPEPPRPPPKKPPVPAPPKPPELAQLPPPPPPPPAPPPPKAQPPAPHQLMAELDDDKDDGANPDAQILAEHNHKVTQQTVARERNLEREDHVQEQSSPSSHTDAPNPGGETNKVAQLEQTKAPDKGRPAVIPQGDAGASRAARGQAAPGPQGTGALGPLSMRDLPPAQAAQQGDALPGVGDMPAPSSPSPGLARGDQPTGKSGTGGGGGLGQYKLNLTSGDYDRIFGEQAAEERQRGASEASSTQGRWDRKWQVARSALENYVPDVQPGNQTALNTAAAPFAAFMAHMHRQIHPLFADGFLTDIEAKPADNPFSNLDLWTNLEIVLNPDGTVFKVTVVKPSGYLPFDAAAIDAVMSAAPYPRPPAVIMSANHKVYLHWGFYRNERACGTFNAEPYILTTPGTGPSDDLPGSPPAPAPGPPTGEYASRPQAGAPSSGHHGRFLDSGGDDGDATGGEGGSEPAAAPSPGDPAAKDAATAWAQALGAADAAALTKASSLPFASDGQRVASTDAELFAMYAQLVKELGGGSIEGMAIFSAAQLRAAGAPLPPSANPAIPSLYAVLNAGPNRLLLTLRRDNDQQWKVAALDR